MAIQLIVSTLFRLAAADPLPGERARDLNQNIETIPAKRVASKWATRAGQAEENERPMHEVGVKEEPSVRFGGGLELVRIITRSIEDLSSCVASTTTMCRSWNSWQGPPATALARC